jgi:hypothetical protein
MAWSLEGRWMGVASDESAGVVYAVGRDRSAEIDIAGQIRREMQPLPGVGVGVNPSVASDDQHTGEALANMISKATKAQSCLHALKHGRFRSSKAVEQDVGLFRALGGPNGSGTTTFLDVVALLGEARAQLCRAAPIASLA